MTIIVTSDMLMDQIGEIAKERDTYRDLCADLLQALILHQELTRPIDNSSIAISKAESIIGDSNAT